MEQLKVGDAAPQIAASDAQSQVVDLEKLCAEKKVLLIFLRHLGCPLCREIIADLSAAYDRISPKAAVIAITESTPKSAAAFAEKRKVPFHLISDREKNSFAAYAVGRGSAASMLSPSVMSSTMRATFRGHMHGKFEGDELQLPADFVIGPSRIIELAHYGRNISDHAPLDKLIAAAIA